MLSDEDRKLINSVQIADALRFGGPQGFIRARRVSFMVGEQGPFTALLDYVDYNAEALDKIFANEIATLRAAKVL